MSNLFETPSLREFLTEFVELEHRRRDLETQLEAVKRRAAEIEPVLLEEFALLGMQNASVDGLTVYVGTDRYVSKRSEVSTETVCEALRSCGLDYLVGDSYNAQSLKSKIREWQEEGAVVPEQLSALLNIGEVHRLRTRKA